MPTGKVHLYLCGKKSWNLHCILYDTKCPIDLNHGGIDWHSFHNNIRVSIFQVEKPPTIEGCVIKATLYLEKMEPYFSRFLSDYYPEVPEKDFRLCWTAHLIADIACPYWVDGNEYPCPKSGYGFIKDNDFWSFLNEIGKQILSPLR